MFADPLPASTPERNDDGSRGLAVLRSEVLDSFARWKALSSENGGRYSYTRAFRSFTGWTCRTTIHAASGAVTSRTELIVQGDTFESLWTETVDELDTHPSSCHPPLTMEALYEQCLDDVLCKDPRNNQVYVDFDDDGRLLMCSFFPNGCQDDCLEGVNLEAIRAGDDAPECCAIDEQPSCCMSYGGADLGGCGVACDGMPLPTAPWTRNLDQYGCPQWIEPPATDECCGCPPT